MPSALAFQLLARRLDALGCFDCPGGGTCKNHQFPQRRDGCAGKSGCNAGTCHGNANGKGGFKLSLRGESPDLDYIALTRELTGRRVDPLDPDQSLLLLKATTQLAHEGGRRFTTNSWQYQSVRGWIAAGAPADATNIATVVKLEVTPAEKVLYAPTKSLDLHATALFSDGSKRDVTSIAVYDVANPIVKVSAEGKVERENFGETTVLVRFLNQQVPVRLAFVPDRPGFVWRKPAENNYVDRHVFAKLKNLKVEPSKLSSDELFIRRASLDLLGILPTADEAKKFVADRSGRKRAKLIDDLLTRPEFADYWALKWSDLLRNEARTLDTKGVENFHHWIRQSIADNKPIDEFVRELVSASGSTYRNPAANFYRANRDPVTRSVAIAQVFMGLRLQCAQCHSHPFDKWTQDDYYNWAASFARLDYKVVQNLRRDENDSHEFKGEQIVYAARSGEVKNPRTGRNATPAHLGELSVITYNSDSLADLARWLTSPQNPYFARAQANRIWFHLMGRGIVDPIDDFRATNPPSHPELLDELTRDFVKHKFDLRHLIRVVMNSRAYQLDSEPTATNADEEVNYSHNVIRRLTAEQLLDCQGQLAGTPPRVRGYPEGMRIAQMPGANTERRRGEKISSTEKFLELFGKPQRLLTCECERTSETTMNQAFNLISGASVNDLIFTADGRVAQLAASARTDNDVITELYWTALTRAPGAAELKFERDYIAKAKSRRAGLEDLAWSLVNSKEFLLRR